MAWYFAEYETGAVTLSVIDSDAFNFDFHANENHLALHVADVTAARETLAGRAARARRRLRPPASHAGRTTHRKPTWLMPVSTCCGRRAAGR